MKTLMLLRHAKSSWGDASLSDHERPLNRRGENAAARMGLEMARRELHPQQVLCSSALRTRQTLERLRPYLPDDVEVRVERELYLAAPRELLARDATLPDEIDRALLIGHNPGIMALARSLAGGGAADALADLERKFPTGALAVLRFGAEPWAAIRAGSGRLDLYLRPKALPPS